MKLPHKLITALLVYAVSSVGWSVTNEELARQLDSLRDASNRVKVSGFISAAASQADEDVRYFAGQFGEGAIDDDPNTESDAVIGLQFDIKATENVDVVAQLRGQGPRGFNTETSLAFVRFKGFNNTQVRAGLLRVPFFVLSEYLDVGYAYPWITPPAEVYGAAPGSQYEGLDIIHNMYIGDWNLRSQPFIGGSCSKAIERSASLDGCFDYIHGISVALSDDFISLHANFSKTDTDFVTNSAFVQDFSIAQQFAETAANDQVEAAFGSTNRQTAALSAAIAATSQFGVTNDFSQCNGDATCQAAFNTAYADTLTAFDTMKNQTVDGVLVGFLGGYALDENFLDGYTRPYDLVNQHIADIRAFQEPDLIGVAHFRSMGFTMVADKLTIMGEAINIDVTGNSRDTEGNYLTFAYNLTDTLQVHITKARTETDDNENRLHPVTGNPTILNTLYDQEQQSIKLGVRYDIFPNVAVKAEAEEISDFHGTLGLFDHSLIGFDTDGEYQIFRVAVDAVF